MSARAPVAFAGPTERKATKVYTWGTHVSWGILVERTGVVVDRYDTFTVLLEETGECAGEIRYILTESLAAAEVRSWN